MMVKLPEYISDFLRELNSQKHHFSLFLFIYLFLMWATLILENTVFYSLLIVIM